MMCTFYNNNGKRYAWQIVGDMLFQPKGKGRGIMVSGFLLPFTCLGLSHLSKIQQEIMRNTGLKFNKAVEILEYGKNNDGYWDGLKLL